MAQSVQVNKEESEVSERVSHLVSYASHPRRAPALFVFLPSCGNPIPSAEPHYSLDFLKRHSFSRTLEPVSRPLEHLTTDRHLAPPWRLSLSPTLGL